MPPFAVSPCLNGQILSDGVEQQVNGRLSFGDRLGKVLRVVPTAGLCAHKKRSATVPICIRNAGALCGNDCTEAFNPHSDHRCSASPRQEGGLPSVRQASHPAAGLPDSLFDVGISSQQEPRAAASARRDSELKISHSLTLLQLLLTVRARLPIGLHALVTRRANRARGWRLRDRLGRLLHQPDNAQDQHY